MFFNLLLACASEDAFAPYGGTMAEPDSGHNLESDDTDEAIEDVEENKEDEEPEEELEAGEMDTAEPEETDDPSESGDTDVAEETTEEEVVEEEPCTPSISVTASVRDVEIEAGDDVEYTFTLTAECEDFTLYELMVAVNDDAESEYNWLDQMVDNGAESGYLESSTTGATYEPIPANSTVVDPDDIYYKWDTNDPADPFNCLGDGCGSLGEAILIEAGESVEFTFTFVSAGYMTADEVFLIELVYSATRTQPAPLASTRSRSTPSTSWSPWSVPKRTITAPKPTTTAMATAWPTTATTRTPVSTLAPARSAIGSRTITATVPKTAPNSTAITTGTLHASATMCRWTQTATDIAGRGWTTTLTATARILAT